LRSGYKIITGLIAPKKEQLGCNTKAKALQETQFIRLTEGDIFKIPHQGI